MSVTVKETFKRNLDSLFTGVILVTGVVLTTGVGTVAVAKGSKNEPPLFFKGVENFKLQKTNGKPVQFVVLNDTASEKALGMAIATSLNAQPETQPKIPVNGPYQLNLERMTLSPVQGKPDTIEVGVRVSGHDLWLPKTIDRKAFLAGKVIELNFPPAERVLTGFTLESKGKLKLRLDKMKNEISILNAEGKVTYSTILGDNGSESLSFTGRGVRQM